MFLRAMGITPQVAQNENRPGGSAIEKAIAKPDFSTSC